MKRFLSWIRNYFGFSSGETNGFLILLPLLAVFIFSEPLYEWLSFKYGRKPIDNTHALDSIRATWEWSASPAKSSAITNAAPFNFDPNSATVDEFTRLGFPEKLAAKIIHYREKGGKFRVRSDLKKIYGMDSALLQRLESFVMLPNKLETTRKLRNNIKPRYAKKASAPRFDLNLADTSQLIAIYGIGSKLAVRIINLRVKLGGFVSVNQLHEVFGLDSAVVDTLKKKTFIAGGFIPIQIDLNTADKKTLTKLPYIRGALANAITVWRFQHGQFKSIDELKQIAIMSELTFEKIKPYLTVKDK